MAETFEGRYWYNEKLPVLYIIADKMPNVNRDNVIISFIKKNKSIDEMITILKKNRVDAVYTDITDLDLIRAIIYMGIVVYVPNKIKGVKSWSVHKWGADIHTIGGYKKSTLGQYVRRTTDVVGGLVGCIPLAVAYPFVAYAIKKEDGGPVIYKQKRVGYNGREFDMYKFRSMRVDADEQIEKLRKHNEMDGNYMFKVEDDPRITKVGKFIRKTSIDELPQFINVLKGDMSIIGTRPPTKKETLNYKARHKIRLSGKPGITGAWQTHGRNEVTDFDEVVSLDKNYIHSNSVLESTNIFLRTVCQMFNKGGK